MDLLVKHGADPRLTTVQNVMVAGRQSDWKIGGLANLPMVR